MEEIELRDEAELESIIRKDPSNLEPGLMIITDQRGAAGGRLDLLAIDSDGVLSLIELKVKTDEGQLQQALNYFDWVLESIDFVRDAYKNKLDKHQREIKDEIPRILLVAPDFNKELVTAAKFLRDDIDLKLLRYKAFSIDGKKEIFTIPVEIPEMKEIEEKPKPLEYYPDYIGNAAVCETFNKVVKFFSTLSDEEPVTKKRNYMFRYDGRKFAEIQVRHGYFWIGLKAEDEWFWKDKVKTIDDVKSIKEQIKTAIGFVGGQFKEEDFL